MKLFDVKVSMLIMAVDRQDAINKTRLYLYDDNYDLDYNFLVHDAEEMDNETLQEIRDRQGRTYIQ